MDILFEGKLVLESAMSEARAKLVDFLATLSTEDKNYALDFFFGDPALNSSDIKSRSYKDKDELINKIYDGSADKLFAALLGRKKLSAGQLERLRQIVGELE